MRNLGTGAALVMAACLATPAQAQQTGSALPVLEPLIRIVEPEDALISVAERYRPEFEARGIRVGNVLLYPSVRAAAGYDTNIFATEDDTRADALYVVEPQLNGRTTWTTNELRFYARGRYLDYLDTQNADEPSYAVGADAQFGLKLPLRWDVGGSFAQQIERRDSSAFPLGQVSPVQFRRGNAYFRSTYEGPSLRLIGSADVTGFDFSSVKALDDELNVVARIDQGFRDRTEVRAGARGEYVVAPRIAVYLQGDYSHVGYEDEVIAANGLQNRDGNEFQITAGTTFDYSLFRGEIGIGYVRHNYDADIYDTIEGFAANARVTYYATPLFTVIADLSRTVEETAVTTASGFFSTRGSVRADYELLRNLLLNADVSYRLNTFEGDPREDRIFRIGGGARYAANPRLAFDTNLFFIDRSSRGADFVPDFQEFQIVVGTTFRL